MFRLLYQATLVVLVSMALTGCLKNVGKVVNAMPDYQAQKPKCEVKSVWERNRAFCMQECSRLGQNEATTYQKCWGWKNNSNNNLAAALQNTTGANKQKNQLQSSSVTRSKPQTTTTKTVTPKQSLEKCSFFSLPANRNCVGTYHYSDGKYEGPLKKGVPHGKGKLIYNDGRTLYGNFKNGKVHGQTTVVHSHYTMTGTMVMGLWSGETSLKYKSGELYVFQMSRGSWGGKAELIMPDGTRLTGTVQSGVPIREGFVPDTVSTNKTIAPSSKSTDVLKINEAKEECADIGFTPGRDQFAECVLELVS